MEWFELDWKLQDSTTISHSIDGYTRDKNLRDILTLFKKKITEVEMNTNVMQGIINSSLNTEVSRLRNENAMMKQLLIKIIQKDYPEIVIEQPEFVSANLANQSPNKIIIPPI